MSFLLERLPIFRNFSSISFYRALEMCIPQTCKWHTSTYSVYNYTTLLRLFQFFLNIPWYNFQKEDYIMKSKFTHEERQAILNRYIKIRIAYKHYKICWHFEKHILQMAIRLSSRARGSETKRINITKIQLAWSQSQAFGRHYRNHQKGECIT